MSGVSGTGGNGMGYGESNIIAYEWRGRSADWTKASMLP